MDALSNMTTSQLQRILKDNKQKYTGYSKEEMIRIIREQFPQSVPLVNTAPSSSSTVVSNVPSSTVSKRASGVLGASSSRVAVKKTKKMIARDAIISGAVTDSIYDSQSADQLHDAIINILSNFTN